MTIRYKNVYRLELQKLFNGQLKGLNQAKIIKKSVILSWFLNMTILYQHVYRLKLQKLFNFCAVHLPARLDIETETPISCFGHACLK